MKKLIATVALIVSTLGLTTVHGAAEPPVEFTIVDEFVDVDPCTGELQAITIVRDLRLPQSGNLAHLSHSGWTSAGYEMSNGVQQLVFQDDGTATGRLMDQWRNPDGSKFRVQSTFVIDLFTGEVTTLSFEARCLGA